MKSGLMDWKNIMFEIKIKFWEVSLLTTLLDFGIQYNLMYKVSYKGYKLRTRVQMKLIELDIKVQKVEWISREHYFWNKLVS